MGNRLFLLVLGALLVAPELLAQRIPAAQWGGFAEGWRFHGRKPARTADPAPASRQDSLHSWDALAYDVRLTLATAPAWLDAQVDIRCAVREPLTDLDLHLRGYSLSSALVDGQPAQVTRQDDRLFVHLPQSAQPGDTLALRLAYAGVPLAEDGLGIFVGSQVTYTLSDPWGTRNWLACYDEPFDKATWRITLRVDSTHTTLCNGILEGRLDHGDGTSSWTWRHDAPMSSYLASLVSGHLTVIEEEWNGLPLAWCVYPQHEDAARLAVSRMDRMLDCYSGLWGEYPFESYAMGEAPIYGGMGGMEHQTCTTIGSGIIAGGLQYESTIAHELSHQWWGDSVTPVDFRQVWLNEGWATLAEALYYQHLADGDEAAYLDYVEQIQQTYLNWDNEFLPIFAPPVDDIFNISQYEKAASVLHMLRELIGRPAFDEAQRQWQAGHRHGTVDTGEYQAALEAAGGQPLDWFFQQWIYAGGYPTYRHSTQARAEDGGSAIHLTVSQTHPRLDSFRALVPLRVATDAAVLDTSVWIEQAGEEFTFHLPGAFDTLIFNHNHTVLCRQQVLPPVGGPPIWSVAGLGLDDSQQGDGDGHLAPGESARLSLTLRNEGGWDTGLGFSVASGELDCAGAWTQVGEAGNGAQIELPAGPVVLSGWDQPGNAYVELELTSTSDSFAPQTTRLQLPVGDPRVLLVGSAGQEGLRPYWEDELDSLRRFSDAWDAADGLPGEALSGHQALLWYTGSSGRSLDAEQQAWLMEQITWSGPLVVVGGQDAFDTPAADCLFQPIELDVSSVQVAGEPGTPLAGLRALLIGAGGAQNQQTPSALEWCGQFGCSAQIWARYQPGGEPAALALSLCDMEPRTLVLGFGLEAVSGMAGTQSRREWLDRILASLDGTPVEDNTRASRPRGIRLGDPHPNPFNPVTSIPFTLERPASIRLELFDLAGRRVRTLVDGALPAGTRIVQLDAQELASGLYLLRLESPAGTATRKLMLLK